MASLRLARYEVMTTQPPAEPNLLERWLARYTSFAVRRPGRVLGVAAVVLFCGSLLASQLQVKGDFVSLLPSQSGTAKRFQAALSRKLAGASTLVVVIESPDSAANERLIDALAGKLRKLPKRLVASIQTGAAAERRYFNEQRWLFASERDLRLVRCELEHERERHTFDLGLDDDCSVRVDDELRELGGSHGDSALAAATSADTLATPTAEAPAQTALARVRQRIEREMAAQDRFKSDYFRNGRGDRYALVIRSSSAGMGDSTSEELLERVQACVTEVEPRRFAPQVELGFTGDIPNAIAERKSLVADIALVSGLACALILAVILGYFRSGWALLPIGLSAALGSSLALGAARLLVGHLNMASGFLASIIAGNGINVPMIYFARYRELRGQGDALSSALVRTALDCRRGTWLGALAAAGAYFSLGVTSFRGFSEFGLIGGVGSLACFLAAFAVCPAAIALLERWRGFAVAGASQHAPGSWLTRGLGVLTTERPWLALSAFALLALALAHPIGGYLANPWEYDFGKLRSASSSARGAGHFSVKADTIFGTRGAPDLLLASDIERAPAVADAVKLRDQQLFDGKLVERVTTVFDYLGGRPEVISRKLALLSDIRREIDAALPRLRGADRTFAEEFRPPERLRPLGSADLPALLRDRFSESDGRFGTAVFVEIDPKLSRSRGQELLRMASLLEGVREGDQVVPNASRATVFAEMIRSMTRDAPRAVAVAFAVVIVVALLATGELVPAAAVLSSLLLAIWTTLGAAAVFDVRLNFLNFVALPLTFGIGVEYAINFYDRVRVLKDVEQSLISVGGAIASCSLTTMLGYGTLLVGDNLALRSFGKFAVVGELSCLATALIALPAGLSLLERRKRLRPTADAEPLESRL